MNPYVQLMALCTFGVGLYGLFSCMRMKYSCNIISYMALVVLALYINIMVVNVYYSIQNYHVYLNHPKEFFMVLAGVGVVNVFFYFTMVKPLNIKKMNSSILSTILLISFNAFNAYYLVKQLLLKK